MKTTKEKADEIINEHCQVTIDIDRAIYHAINAVKYTIEVLKEVNDLTIIDRAIVNAIDEQTELLTELESRV